MLCCVVCVYACVSVYECRCPAVRLLGLFEALAWGSKKGALG